MSKTTRLLSLILVIAMAFSLFAVSGSAKWADVAKDAYTDYATGNYKEAIDVLTYINVIDGIADGDATAFKPEGNLQRDAAAKIISRLITGVTASDIVPTGTIFSDVPKTQWASGYIQWAYNNNIINGLGDGTFAPTSNVTVLQFLKMILTGLGWGAQGEFTGKGWDTAVYIKATELGLWGDVTPVVSDRAATREEAVEFALQALLQYPVVFGQTYDYKTYDGAYVSHATGGYKLPLYILHGLNLDIGSDKLGYKTYQWVDPIKSYIIYEGLAAWTKQFVITNTTKITEFTNGLTAGSIEADVYINGASDRLITSTSALPTAFKEFVKEGYLSSFYGATVTEYIDSYLDGYGNTVRFLDRVVIEVELYGSVTSATASTKKYNLKVEGNVGANKTTSKNYNTLDNTLELVKGDIVAAVPVFKTFNWIDALSGTLTYTLDELYAVKKSTTGGSYAGWYWYENPENKLKKDRLFTLGGKQTLVSAFSPSYKDLTAEAYSNGGRVFTLGTTGVIIYAAAPAAVERVAPSKFALVKDPGNYSKESKANMFAVETFYTYNAFDAVDAAGAAVEVDTIIVESATSKLSKNQIIAYYDTAYTNSSFKDYPVGWYAYDATAVTTFVFSDDARTLRTNTNTWTIGTTTENDYEVVSGAIFYNAVTGKFINSRTLSYLTNADLPGTKFYLNKDKKEIIAVIINVASADGAGDLTGEVGLVGGKTFKATTDINLKTVTFSGDAKFKTDGGTIDLTGATLLPRSSGDVYTGPINNAFYGVILAAVMGENAITLRATVPGTYEVITTDGEDLADDWSNFDSINVITEEVPGGKIVVKLTGAQANELRLGDYEDDANVVATYADTATAAGEFSWSVAVVTETVIEAALRELGASSGNPAVDEKYGKALWLNTASQNGVIKAFTDNGYTQKTGAIESATDLGSKGFAFVVDNAYMYVVWAD